MPPCHLAFKNLAIDHRGQHVHIHLSCIHECLSYWLQKDLPNFRFSMMGGCHVLECN